MIYPKFRVLLSQASTEPKESHDLEIIYGQWRGALLTTE